ncbi:MAG: M20 family peptidase [Acidobacteriota bacterium]
MVRRLLLLAVIAVLALVSILALRAMQLGGDAQPIGEPAELEPVDIAGATERFAEAIRIATISRSADDFEREALVELHQLLADRFPLTHATLDREVVGEASLLYRWPGRSPALEPLVLMGHLDVVPAVATDWTHPPFSGFVDDEFIWGRGTIDNKVNVLGALEAVEHLLARGFAPTRTVYLAFGHDEEVGGRGAQAIAQRLADANIEPFMILDEGGLVLRGGMPGVERPVALLGAAEKGYVSLRLEASGTGGHSSMPPREHAVGVLARALVALDEHPMPARYDGLTADFFGALAPEMPFSRRVIFANLWLLEPLVIEALSSIPGTNAMLRTTTAPTMLEGSPKDNILPRSVSAVVNFRIHPEDRSADVIDHVRRVIDDERVTVEPTSLLSEPATVAPVEGEAWDALTSAVRTVYSDAILAPSLVVAATDARHYRRLTDRVYNFTPVVLTEDDLTRIHGVDERIGIDTYADTIRFYRELIRVVAGG